MESTEKPTIPWTSEKSIFIAPAARGGDGHGYLNQPLRHKLPQGLDEFALTDQAARVREARRPEDEPEAIGPSIVKGYTEVAQFQHSLQHHRDVESMRQLRKLLAAEDRLVDAMRRAKKHHRRDLSGEFRLAKQMAERARKGTHTEYVERENGSLTTSSIAPTPPRLERLLERIESELDGVPLEDAA